MERFVGTISRGIRAPIIRQGDPLGEIVVQSVLEAAETGGFSVQDRDVVAITEAVVARAQGNYAGVEDIAADIRAKFGGETLGVIFPHFEPEPLCHLPAGHCHGSQEDCPHAQLSFR